MEGSGGDRNRRIYGMPKEFSLRALEGSRVNLSGRLKAVVAKGFCCFLQTHHIVCTGRVVAAGVARQTLDRLFFNLCYSSELIHLIYTMIKT